jgi:hypothetical protein
VDYSTVLFSRYLASPGGDSFAEDYSVCSSGQMGVKSRTFVHHEGDNSGNGVWICSKDVLGQCEHIKLARAHLQKLLKAANPSATEDVNCPHSQVQDTQIGEYV